MAKFFFFQAEDGIRDYKVTGVQTCALPISPVPREAQRAAPVRPAVQRVAWPGLPAAGRRVGRGEARRGARRRGGRGAGEGGGGGGGGPGTGGGPGPRVRRGRRVGGGRAHGAREV